MDIGILEKETTMHRNLHAVYRIEEDYLRQKVICLWLNARDKNNSFFHKQAEGCKHYKEVKEIQIQGQVVQEFEEIKKVVCEHFQNIYTEDTPP